MPNQNGIGYSDDTARKETIYRHLLSWHFNITQAVLRKHTHYRQTYRLIDANSGCGVIPGTDEDASPLIAARMLAEQDRPYSAHFIEWKHENVALLSERLREADLMGGGAVECILGDNDTKVPLLCDQFGTNAFGLIYQDSTELPNWELLRKANERCRFIDQMVWVNSTGIKRTRVYGKPSLETGMRISGKKFWLVREPEGRWRFSFLLGVNSDKVFDSWRALGFYRAIEPRGREILNYLEFTEKEWKERMQQTLSGAV